MVIVLVSARYKKIIQWLKKDSPYYVDIIQQKGAKFFLWVECESYAQIMHDFQHIICQNGGSAYVYAFYCLYNGMIDYMPYLQPSVKETQKYYQTAHKDLSDLELQEYLKKMS